MRLRPPAPICNDAEFSEDGTRRYWLSRHVGTTGPVGLMIGCNPSIAGAENNDPTVRKWTGFTTRWGWSGYWVGNMSTHIETKSAKLRTLTRAELVRPEDDAVLDALIAGADHIVLCWGNGVPKCLKWRISDVLTRVHARCREIPVSTFGLSKEGQPMHPLMLSYDTPLEDFYPEPRASRRDE